MRTARDGDAGDGVRLHDRLEQEGWGAAYREGRSLPFGAVAALALSLLDEVAQALTQHELAPDSAQQPQQPSQHADRSPLSAREQEVVRLVAQGLSNKAIGRQIFLSASTVNQHLNSVFRKLGVNSRAQAVAVAAQRGLLWSAGAGPLPARRARGAALASRACHAPPQHRSLPGHTPPHPAQRLRAGAMVDQSPQYAEF